MASEWVTGDPTASPANLTPYYYGPHLQNTMYHWDPDTTHAAQPTGGYAWVLWRYGGGFRTGNAGFSGAAYFSSMSADAATFPVHQFQIDCRESQQQFDQADFSRKKLNSYPATIEEGVDDFNLAYQYILSRAEEWGLNPSLGGGAGTSSGSITTHGATFLPGPAAYRGFDPGLFPYEVRPPFLAMFECPWNPMWMQGRSGMDYAFVETAHDPDNLSDTERDDAYEALGDRIQMFNSYENILTAGHEPYICSGYDSAEYTSSSPPSNFSLGDPHDARHGYFMHKRLSDEVGYADSKHLLLVTDGGGSYGAPAADWWEVNTSSGATTAAQWQWMKDTIEALPDSGY